MHDALKIPEVAIALRIAPSEVRKLVQSGEIAHVRIGTRLRVPSFAVEEYLRARATCEWTPDPVKQRAVRSSFASAHLIEASARLADTIEGVRQVAQDSHAAAVRAMAPIAAAAADLDNALREVTP